MQLPEMAEARLVSLTGSSGTPMESAAEAVTGNPKEANFSSISVPEAVGQLSLVHILLDYL